MEWRWVISISAFLLLIPGKIPILPRRIPFQFNGSESEFLRLELTLGNSLLCFHHFRSRTWRVSKLKSRFHRFGGRLPSAPKTLSEQSFIGKVLEQKEAVAVVGKENGANSIEGDHRVLNQEQMEKRHEPEASLSSLAGTVAHNCWVTGNGPEFEILGKREEQLSCPF